MLYGMLLIDKNYMHFRSKELVLLALIKYEQIN